MKTAKTITMKTNTPAAMPPAMAPTLRSLFVPLFESVNDRNNHEMQNNSLRFFQFFTYGCVLAFPDTIVFKNLVI